jgi:hypothetical protein
VALVAPATSPKALLLAPAEAGGAFASVTDGVVTSGIKGTPKGP